MKPFLTVALASLLTAGAAAAHVVITPERAPAGGYYAGDLRVSHGCDGSPTVSLRVEIPPDVVSAKPQPKPGWRLSVERAPLAAPVAGEGGRMIRDRVAAITWTGLLPDDQFDTFGLMMRLPARTGALPLPVTQRCRKGSTAWVETVSEGAARPAHPAPRLMLEGAPEPAHRH